MAAASLAMSLTVAFSPVMAQQGEISHEQTAASARQDLEKSLKELADLRERIANEKVPMNRELRTREERLAKLRAELDDLNRGLDTTNLDLGNLRSGADAREKEIVYLSNLLDEYIRNLESRVHITELQRYRESLEKARLAPEDSDLSPGEIFRIQSDMIRTSLERVEELVGGASFEGTAVDEGGRLAEVTFTLIGPVAVFRTPDGERAGLAEQRIGSLEPNMVPFGSPEAGEQVKTLVASGSGTLPFDPTLGNARKVEATEDSLIEHVSKGGPVMIPILILALAAFGVALAKWVQLMRIRMPSPSKVKLLLEAVRIGDHGSAIEKVKSIKGPTGEMLQAGLEHISEPKELVEEVMFERMLETRLRLQSFLSFIAVSASAAPLLGLLGTVTGIINTFKLITVFGTGDAKTLSSGISEALITTEFGLIVAIPSLLLHAFLSRKARRLVDGMEKSAVSFLNRIVPSTSQSPGEVRRGNGSDRRTSEEGQPVIAGAGQSPMLAVPRADVADH